MTREDQINALLSQAEPLRALPDDAQAASDLGAIVDRINALRAEQAAGRDELDAAIAERDEAEFAATAASVNPPKRGPGRPKKASIYGEDSGYGEFAKPILTNPLTLPDGFVTEDMLEAEADAKAFQAERALAKRKYTRRAVEGA